MKLNIDYEFVIKDDNQLNELLEYWQDELSLQAWNIRAMLSKAKGMDLKDVEGECLWTLSNRTALIRLLSHDEYDNDLFSHDMERILVHELLHLHFAPFFTDEDELEEEQTIDLLANVIVNMKRKSK